MKGGEGTSWTAMSEEKADELEVKEEAHRKRLPV